MSDREALAAALDREPKEGWIATSPIISAAARERLAQLPEKCEHGQTEPHPVNNWPHDAISECSGKMYPAELVERIALAAMDANKQVGDLSEESWERFQRIAVAVLDALNSPLTTPLVS